MNQIESGLKSAMCKAVSQAFDLEYSEEQHPKLPDGVPA